MVQRSLEYHAAANGYGRGACMATLQESRVASDDRGCTELPWMTTRLSAASQKNGKVGLRPRGAVMLTTETGVTGGLPWTLERWGVQMAQRSVPTSTRHVNLLDLSEQ